MDYDRYLGYIPLLSRPNEESTAIAEYMNRQMTSGTGDFYDLSESIFKVFGSLKTMESKTQIYNAKKGKDDAKQQAAATGLIDDIASEYIGLKEEYNTLFRIGEKRKSKKDYMKKPKKESKIQSLDDLIAETLRDIKKKTKK